MQVSVYIKLGYADYFNLGISPKKLVMGVPWYGYDFVCLHFSQVRDRSFSLCFFPLGSVAFIFVGIDSTLMVSVDEQLKLLECLSFAKFMCFTAIVNQ